MTLSMIRHGKTSANEKRLYCGHTDISLCDQGREEVLALKKTISYPTAALSVSSALRRAIETLRIINDKEPDVIMSELMEMNFGDFEMKSHEELMNNPDYRCWINDIDNIACPNGENKAIFESRVKKGIHKLCDMNVESVIIVSHGGVISHIMEWLFPGQKEFFEWQPGFGRGYMLEINHNKAELIDTI